MVSMKRKPVSDIDVVRSCKRQQIRASRLLGGGKNHSKTIGLSNVSKKTLSGESTSADPTTPTTPSPKHGSPPSAGSPFEEVPPRVDQTFVDAISSQHPTTFQNVGPIGLANPQGRNICYRNGALTVLLYSEHFRRYLLSWHLPNEFESQDSTERIKTHHCWLLKFLVDVVQASNTTASDSKIEGDIDGIVRRMWNMVGFPVGSNRGKFDDPWSENRLSIDKPQRDQQEDTAEFMQWLLDAIEGQLRTFADPTWIGPFEWMVKQRKVKRIHCLVCKHPVYKRKPSIATEYITKLYLLGKNSLALENMLHQELRSTASMKCDRCKETSEVEILESWQHAPAILLFQFVRSTPGSKDATKSFRKVRLPQVLDATPYLDPQQYGDSMIKYRLSGAVTHAGKSIDGGHFRSFVRGGSDRDQWWQLDDNIVSKEDGGTKRFDGTDPKEKTREYSSYLIMYERDFETETIKPGRPPRNVNKGKDEDEPLSPEPNPGNEQTDPQEPEDTDTSHPEKPEGPTDGGKTGGDGDKGGTESEKQSEDNPQPQDENGPGRNDSPGSDDNSGDKEWNVFDGLAVDKLGRHPQAQLNVTVVLGNLELHLDPAIIYHYNISKERQVVIEASLWSQRGEKKQQDKVIDLAQAFVDGVYCEALDKMEEIEASWNEIQARLLKQKKWKTKAELDQAVDAAIMKRVQAWRSKHEKSWDERWKTPTKTPKKRNVAKKGVTVGKTGVAKK